MENDIREIIPGIFDKHDWLIFKMWCEKVLKIDLTLLHLNQPDPNTVQVELNQFVFSSTAYFTLKN